PPAGAPPGQYPPPAGAPPGQYPPPAGAPPPPGQYPGYYPPPAGYPQYPGYPPAGYPAYPGYPPPPGAPGQPPAPYYPPYGYTPGYPQYPPPLGAPAQQPGTPAPGQEGQPPAAPGSPAPGQPAFPGAPPAGAYHPGYPAAPPGAPYGAPGYPTAVGAAPLPSGFPVWYLGSQIVDPNTPPAPLGAEKVPGYNPEADYNQLKKLAQITGTADEAKVGRLLLNLGIRERDALNDYFVAKSGKDLVGWLDGLNPDNRAPVLKGLAQGPLAFDVELLKRSLAGIGTDEMLLTELVLNRNQDELRLLIAAYKKRWGKDLVDDVKNDLSGKLERMFVMALNTQRTPDSVPVDPNQVNADVDALGVAAKKKEEMPFIEIFVNRSQPHLAAVITTFGQRNKSLSKVIKRTFSGDLMKSLLYILHGIKSKRDGQGIWRDAKLLEKTMAGLGTRDAALIYRTLRASWNPQRMEAIKTAYKNRFGKTLEHRIKGETSGGYREVMIMIVKQSEGK
ncbi:Annexin, partial [Coprinellus micaceus]